MFRKPTFQTLVFLALAVLLTIAVITLSRAPLAWLFPAASAAEPPRVVLPPQLTAIDRMSYVMPITDGHPLCWGDGNLPQPRAIRFYRYRVEGGPKTLYLTLPSDLWVAQPVATNYCTAGVHKVPKAGHWIYEAEICWLPVAPDGSNCSDRVSAGCPRDDAKCAGMVGDTNRGWWVYAYLPPPTVPVVD